MIRIFLAIAFLSYLNVFGQTSEKYNSDYAEFYHAEELFEKEHYGAARMEFRKFMDVYQQPNDPMYVKAAYYEAISALELYNNDAISLLEQFNRNYPESIYKKDIYFRLGKFYYYKKKYDDALVWFNKLSAFDVEEEDREEFYFKIGYANFKLKKYQEARDAFYEVKDGVTQYASPALYYYSYIAYKDEKYQTALEGFLKLQDDEKFGKAVVFYIAQIYYLQGKYDEVTKYAEKLSGNGKLSNESAMNHLVGDAFFRTGKYDEAVPYLEKYDKLSQTTRDDDYRLGYAYYKSGHCKKAIRMFDRVKKVKDSLGQVAYYHIGECMLKSDNKISARSAFEEAAFIEMDPVIQEDALFHYALLSYQLDINPYDEAVEAFELYLNRYPNSERREDVYQYLVNVYTSTNNYTKALASLDKLPNKDIKLKTAYQLIAFNQGVERYQKSNFTGAVNSFKLVDKYKVDLQLSGKAVYWKADANYRLNKYDEAIAGYNKFMGLPSTQLAELKKEALYNIGYAYLKKDDKAKSIEAFRNYLQSNPSMEKKKADAYMRVADSYFLKKNNEAAVEFYQKALDQKAGYEDQALFYMARTYGYMNGRVDDKISKLLQIVNNYKSSKYVQIAIYEVALSYKSNGRFSQALKYFKQIVYDYPSSNLVTDSRINIADIYAKQGNFSQAEQGYRSVLDDHGNIPSVCKAVAQGLRDLYVAMNQPEKLEQLAAQYDCIQLDPQEQENLYYLPAIEAYNDNTKPDEARYQAAKAKFDKYLSKFPSGRYAYEVKNYLADCHYVLGDTEAAITLYKQTLKSPNSGFTEIVSSRVAKHLFNNGEYEESIKYYERMEKVGSTPEILSNAKLGLMRSHFLVENWSKASVYSDKVLENTQLNDELKLEAYYAKGISNYHLKDFAKALSALKWVTKNTTTVKAAEAQFTIASIGFESGSYGSAHKEITKLLKMKPKYNFWVAKGLILQTRVYMAEDNLFDAEERLKSVIEHYPIQDDGVLDEANELWNELMQLKDTPKNIKPNTNTTIEIGE